ncbi:hypothetical protein [Mucilaginibacter celer]|uniref:Uncharacterized protein n=1 Tax=Mucilaginibacter celer TaxID=2305508 RepID=A0A494VP69_9SPHI|nr:hypothetical protein [Mucilaginibacter celer]AYL94910.1 hypothetical protein HYN43_006180 [Mucilaginibacter celer]
MKIHLLPIGLLLLLMSCRQTAKPINTKQADTAAIIQKADTTQNLKEAGPVIIDDADSPPDNGWTDSLLTAYLKSSHNKLITMAVADTSIHEEWLFDSVRPMGKSKYFVYNVGHDYNNGDGVVFASDSWVFIDSATRKLYESQPDESLKEWKQ